MAGAVRGHRDGGLPAGCSSTFHRARATHRPEPRTRHCGRGRQAAGQRRTLLPRRRTCASFKEDLMMTPANDLFARNRTVGEIAASLPGATEVFRRFGLDFCCKGNVALDESARQRGVDVSEVEQALSALPVDGKAEAPSETIELIDHILARYHEIHRRELRELVQLARKVEKVHAGNPAVPHGLADLLDHTRQELEQHMAKEELILFPAMA